MKLYTNPMSPNCKRAAVTAAELGLPLEKVILDPSKGQNKTPEYLALNPMGKIPTFQDDDGWVLWESTAIALYLAEKHPQKGLLPAASDVRARANVHRWLSWNASHLERGVYEVFGQRVLRPMLGGTTDETIAAQGEKDLGRFLPVLNGLLEGKEWVAGTFGVADIALGVSTELLRHPGCKFDLTPYVHVGLWLDRLAARPSWKA